MVLNGDSKHPNPWRPLMTYDNHFAFAYQPLRIYKGYPNAITDTDPFKPYQSFIASNPVGKRYYIIGKKAFLLGALYSTLDTIALAKPLSPRVMVARSMYFIVPTTACALSYMAARDLFGLMSERLFHNHNEATWTFPAATIAPATIWARCYGLGGAGLILTVGSLFALAHKVSCDYGYNLTASNKNDTVSLSNPNHWKWKGLDSFTSDDPGPAWKVIERQEQEAKNNSS